MNPQHRRRVAAFGPRIQPGVCPSDDIELVWSLAARAASEGKRDRDAPFTRALHAIIGTKRFVLTKQVTALAEDLRISDLGVTINSFEKGRPFPGCTWLEWDGAVEGRGEPLPHEVRYDRLGVLIEADDTGQRGHMVAMIRVAPGEGVYSGTADMLPLALTFDLRDAYEQPESLTKPATLDKARRRLAAVQDPTLAEMEASPQVAAALSCQLGTIENPYSAAYMDRHLGSGLRRWHQLHPDLMATATGEVMVEAIMTLCAFMVLRTVGIEATEVRRGAGRRLAIHGIDTSLLGFGMLNVATHNRPRSGWGGSLQSAS